MTINPLERFALGAWQLSGPSIIHGRNNGWGDFSEAQAETLLSACEQAGLNYIDTAAAYGNGESELRIGRFLPVADVEICTKLIPEPNMKCASAFQEPYVRGCLIGSLARLNRACVDTYLLHNPDTNALPGQKLFRTLQREGLIRHFGISARDRFAAKKAIDVGFGDTIELQYNALDRRSQPMISQAHALGMRVFLRGVLASGYLQSQAPLLTSNDIRALATTEQQTWLLSASASLAFLDELPGGRAVSALRFALGQPATKILVGMRDPARIAQMQLAGSLGALPSEMVEKIERAVPVPFDGWP